MNTNRHRICVIGLGNTLMQDDGVGVRIMEAIREEYVPGPHIDLIDGGTLGLDLLPVIENYDKVIFLDAVDAGEPPGSVVLLEGDAIPSFLSAHGSVHHVGLTDLLFAARVTGFMPPEVCLIGIQPKSIDIGVELTDVLHNRLGMFVTAVMEQLRKWDIKLRPV